MTNDLRFLKQQPSPPTRLSEKTLTFGFQIFLFKTIFANIFNRMYFGTEDNIIIIALGLLYIS